MYVDLGNQKEGCPPVPLRTGRQNVHHVADAVEWLVKLEELKVAEKRKESSLGMRRVAQHILWVMGEVGWASRLRMFIYAEGAPYAVQMVAHMTCALALVSDFGVCAASRVPRDIHFKLCALHSFCWQN